MNHRNNNNNNDVEKNRFSVEVDAINEIKGL